MQPRWLYITVAACVLPAAMLIPAHRNDLATLERLAPRIERARALTPDTKDTIMRLVNRVRDGAGDRRELERRQLAVRRVTDALNASDGLSTIGRGAPELSPTQTSSSP
jgi:hypothetical protein